MRLQFVVFCFSFVFEISAWIVLLAEVAVVSWPKSLCNDPRSGCAVQSEVIYALGIALASLSILFVSNLKPCPCMLLILAPRPSVYS